jgi:hypothetical protein
LLVKLLLFFFVCLSFTCNLALINPGNNLSLILLLISFAALVTLGSRTESPVWVRTAHVMRLTNGVKIRAVVIATTLPGEFRLPLLHLLSFFVSLVISSYWYTIILQDPRVNTATSPGRSFFVKFFGHSVNFQE